MAVNAFVSFFDKADGESVQKGKEKWVEIRGWDWEVESEASFAGGGGGSVGKPIPGKMSFEHSFDASSTVVLSYITTARAFPKVELQVAKAMGKNVPETYFTMTMENVFITRVSNTGTEDGSILQRVQLVFKSVKIDYKGQNPKDGSLLPVKSFSWIVP